MRADLQAAGGEHGLGAIGRLLPVGDPLQQLVYFHASACVNAGIWISVQCAPESGLLAHVFEAVLAALAASSKQLGTGRRR
jgi:hypothetical protein